MKKYLALVLAIVCCLGLMACGSSSSDADKVAAYLEDNRSNIESALVDEIEALGMDIDADFKADGTKIVVDVKFNDLVDVTDEVKDQMQVAFDGMQSQFDEILDGLQKELPELSGLVYNVYEQDGDLVAKVEA